MGVPSSRPKMTRSPGPPSLAALLPLSALDLQVLLVLAGGELYGYAIMKAVEEQSGGVLRPEIGSLYRVIARLMAGGWVVETEPADVPPHPGVPRRYYDLTPEGRVALSEEARRLREISDLAHRRLGVSRRGV